MIGWKASDNRLTIRRLGSLRDFFCAAEASADGEFAELSA
jgi:hypothetical protein